MIENDLAASIDADRSLGSHHVSKRLGIQKMPRGYALMVNADLTHFYWLRHDGVNSAMDWNKWSVYHGAKKDAAKFKKDD